MVSACIYDNIPSRGGYGIHARSADFPYSFEQDIDSVSGFFAAGNGYEESTAIRYAPVRNGKYLLTWVLRHPVAYTEGQRAWHTEVHFLLDAQAADELFRYPISAVAERVGRKAYEMWRTMNCELDGGLKLFGKDEHSGDNWDATGRVDDCILLAGAFYCGQGQGARQLFLESDDPWGEMDMIQRCLPYALRKELSFCIGLQSQQESKGTVFNLPTNIGLQQLRSAYGEGVPMSEKYWSGDEFGDKKLYHDCDLILGRMNNWKESLLNMLFTVITKWNELRALAEDQLGEGVNNVIMRTGQDVWCKHLQSERYQSQDLEWLQDLVKDNKRTKLLQKEIKRQLRDFTKEKAVAPKPEGRQQKTVDEGADEALLKKLLLNHATRGAMIAVMAVVLVVTLTLLRQILKLETVEVEHVIYYCISGEATVDIMKLLGAFLCGALSFWSVSVFIKTFRRKK